MTVLDRYLTDDEQTILAQCDPYARAVMLDRKFKHGSFDTPDHTFFESHSAIPSDLELELFYRDPVVTPVVDHSHEDWWELLSTMEATVSTPDEDLNDDQRAAIEQFDTRVVTSSERTARYEWNDDFFQDRSTPMHLRRGRIHTGPILSFGGDDISICTTRSYVQRKNTPDQWDERFTVFVRVSEGRTDPTKDRKKRSFIVWRYDAYLVFTTPAEALEWSDRLHMALRNEIQLEDHWYSAQYTPGEHLPFDPAVLENMAAQDQLTVLA